MDLHRGLKVRHRRERLHRYVGFELCTVSENPGLATPRTGQEGQWLTNSTTGTTDCCFDLGLVSEVWRMKANPLIPFLLCLFC